MFSCKKKPTWLIGQLIQLITLGEAALSPLIWDLEEKLSYKDDAGIRKNIRKAFSRTGTQ